MQTKQHFKDKRIISGLDRTYITILCNNNHNVNLYSDVFESNNFRFTGFPWAVKIIFVAS